MKLPNGTNAVVDIVKLRDYCLNSGHPEGRHKARVFRATLGMKREDAEELRAALLAAARDQDAEYHVAVAEQKRQDDKSPSKK